ncbi:MAG: hypothetical protein ACR2LT_09725 [Pyrinomonadaceae bacterium]
MNFGLKCPVCRRTRIRRGYRPTPFWSKILLRFNLLCDNCNWEFTGFALPWTIPAKHSKNSRKRRQKDSIAVDKEMARNLNDAPAEAAETRVNTVSETERKEPASDLYKKKRIKKRVKNLNIS